MNRNFWFEHRRDGWSYTFLGRVITFDRRVKRFRVSGTSELFYSRASAEEWVRLRA